MRNDDIRRRPDGSIDIGFYARRSARFRPDALRHLPGQLRLGTTGAVRRLVERLAWSLSRRSLRSPAYR